MRTNLKKARPVEAQARTSDLSGPLREAREIALSGAAHHLQPGQLLQMWGPHFSAAELHEWVVPERTLARRLAKHEALTIPETDRALRLARAATEAARVFGNADKAARWLRKPNASLGGQTPLSLLRTETGAKAVEESLIQIDHGIFA
ncbi:antitoxin Xre/MbcA/ParS toxin-binding domain-containing protein [Methylocapsa sp. S129]|uniref:type II RES/Xre toxin-antitoxin system antitoxin n=1 Tax=Methylocapsa sp. S129 TaxID=1641869 RepID=UPI00131C05C1|nr:antitoxin Xre/MbcA/ParS toxin-binding domain-containing protein [Methylocapsa sp. S129]